MEGKVPGIKVWLERPQVRRNVIIFAVGFFVVTFALTVYRAVDIHRSTEFRDFRSLSRIAVLANGQQYEEGDTRAYPPFFTIAFLPFSLGPTALGATLFYVVCAVGYSCSVWWLCRTVYGDCRDGLQGLAILSWLVGLQLFADVILRCETDAIILTAMASAVFLIVVLRRPITGGFLLGFAAAFKVLPVLFGIFLLCQRRWRAALGMALGGIFFTAILPMVVWGPRGAWERHVNWVDKVVLPYRTAGAVGIGGIGSGNQSLTAALHRFLRPVENINVNIANLPYRIVRRIALVLQGALAFLFISFWIFAYRKDRPDYQELTLFATVPIAILLLSEVSLTTHHLVLMPALVVILGRYARSGGERKNVGWMIWLVPFFMAVMILIGFKWIKDLSPMVLVTLLLGWACVRLALRDQLIPKQLSDISRNGTS